MKAICLGRRLTVEPGLLDLSGDPAPGLPSPRLVHGEQVPDRGPVLAVGGPDSSYQRLVLPAEPNPERGAAYRSLTSPAIGRGLLVRLL